MKASKIRYVCSVCSAFFPKWNGKCDSCGGWNTLHEETFTPSKNTKNIATASTGSKLIFSNLKTAEAPPERHKSGINELDRVLGGGFVEGSAILVAGDPGIGKSTLLMQSVAKLAKLIDCAYISGEESVSQLQSRANRLGVSDSPVNLATSNNVNDILTSLNAPNPPKVLVIDSIQTMALDEVDSSPGSVSQVRASAFALINLCKEKKVILILVGHVTREGQIAGPKVLEHMVDAVLYFEGEKQNEFRILRAVKNRFGATDEIGIFGMSEEGLEEIENPSALFLNDHKDEQVSGTCVFASIEGTRPLLVEIQALVVPTTLATPRRAVVGFDSNRLSMIVAVLEARAGLSFGFKDIYLNVAGGLKITEPSADLCVASALVSALSGKPLPLGLVAVGELSLSGQVRRVPHADKRLMESKRLGFSHFLTHKLAKNSGGIKVIEVDYIRQLLPKIFN